MTILSGDGTKKHPFLIFSADDLLEISKNIDYLSEGLFFRQMANVDLAEAWSMKIFSPIGNKEHPFKGIYDGNNKIIHNLAIKSSENHAGMFGFIDICAEVSNLELKDCSVVGKNFVGALAGENRGVINNCSVTGEVKGSGNCIGAIVGYNKNLLTSVRFRGCVCGNDFVGGLVGFNSLSIHSCCSVSEIEGKGNNAGGLVGFNSNGDVVDCYVKNTRVTSRGNVGGLIGYNDVNGSITNCYSVCCVSGEIAVGSLIGNNIGYVNNCFTTDTELAITGYGSVSESYAINGYTNRLNWSENVWKELKLNSLPELKVCGSFLESYQTDIRNSDAQAQIEEVRDLLLHDIYGDGSVVNPFQIWTAEQLHRICNKRYLSKNYCFLQMADIDLKAYSTGRGWQPIGDSKNQFCGYYDGNGRSISNLTINSNKEMVGLFGCIDQTGVIKNIVLKNANIQGNFNIGGITGINNGNISSCSVQGYFSGTVGIGFLSGGNNGIIENCFGKGEIDYDESDRNKLCVLVGGIAGINSDKAKINNCYTDLVDCPKTVGNIAGNNSGVIENCFWLNPECPVVTKICEDNDIKVAKGEIINSFFSESYNKILNWSERLWDLSKALPELTFFDSCSFDNSLKGKGTCDEPFQIWTAHDLIKLRGNRLCNGKYFFKQMDDIDLDSINEEEFIPIGSKKDVFNSDYNGNFKTIKNLRILNNRTCAGLFAYLGYKGKIYDLSLDNVCINANIETGALVGISLGYISNCHVNGNIKGIDKIGGIVGGNIGKIVNCSTDAKVCGCSHVGAIAGMNGYDEIANKKIEHDIVISGCYSNSSISGETCVGGIVGANISRVTGCCFDGKIDFEVIAPEVSQENSGVGFGKIVGYNSYGTIDNCYATASIKGKKEIGGILGSNNEPGRVNNCYSIGEIIGEERIGSIVGYNEQGEIYVESCFTDNPDIPYINSDIANKASYKNCNNNGKYNSVLNWSDDFWCDLSDDLLPKLKKCGGIKESGSGQAITKDFIGSGTARDPFHIYTHEDLVKLNQKRYLEQGYHFIQINDIDLSSYQKGEGWKPIGSDDLCDFVGVYDGNNKVITGLKIRNKKRCAGLFGVIGNNSIIKNLGVVNADIICRGFTGIIAGINDGIVSNCYSTGKIICEELAGGLIGTNNNTIKNCFSICDIQNNSGKKGHYICGIAATHSGKIISNSYFIGKLTGVDVCGLAQIIKKNSVISNCFVTAMITASNSAAGISANNMGTIRNCFSTGKIKMSNNGTSGKIVNIHLDGIIENCYSTIKQEDNKKVKLVNICKGELKKCLSIEEDDTAFVDNGLKKEIIVSDNYVSSLNWSEDDWYNLNETSLPVLRNCGIDVIDEDGETYSDNEYVIFPMMVKKTNISIGEAIQIVFNGDLVENTDYSAYVYIAEENGRLIKCNYSYDNKILSILPVDCLEYAKTYKITVKANIPTHIKNVKTLSLDTEFTTEKEKKEISVKLEEVVDVPIKGEIKLLLSGDVDIGTNFSEVISVKNKNGKNLNINCVCGKECIFIKPQTSFSYGTEYEIIIKKDIPGDDYNKYVKSTTLSFITAFDKITSELVENTDISVEKGININFSGDIDTKDFSKYIKITDNSKKVIKCRYKLVNHNLTIIPEQPLDYKSVYSVEVSENLPTGSSFRKVVAMKTEFTTEIQFLTTYMEGLEEVPVNNGFKLIFTGDIASGINYSEYVKMYATDDCEPDSEYKYENRVLTVIPDKQLDFETDYFIIISEDLPTASDKTRMANTKIRFNTETLPISGNGTKNDSYIIKTARQLSLLNSDKYLGKGLYFVQVEDIDLKCFSEKNGWTPIGSVSKPFCGIYDGNNHKITGLSIKREKTNGVALFSVISKESELININLEDVEISGKDKIAGLVATNYGFITRCYVSGKITGGGNAGAIAGFNIGKITKTISSIYLKGKGNCFGALVGYNEGSITSCCSKGGSINIKGEKVGGLVGKNSSKLANSYSTTYVEGTCHVGGLVGYNEKSVSRCYSTGCVKGRNHIGGILGFGSDESTIIHCFTTNMQIPLVGLGKNNNCNRNEFGYKKSLFWTYDIWENLVENQLPALKF